MQSPRYRLDSTRTQGIANYVAAGGTPLEYAVVSEAELQRFSTMVQHQRQDVLEQQAHRQQLKERSQMRMHVWPDTLEAKRKQYLVDRQNRLDADERRRQLLDEEERKFQEAQREQRLRDANRVLMERDERGKQMRSTLLFHHVLEERKLQEQWSEEKRQQLLADEEAFAKKVREAALAEVQEKALAQQVEKEKILSVKIAQQAKLNELIEERRSQRTGSEREAGTLRQSAEEEKRENAEKVQRQRKELERLKEEQLLQMSPRLSPREALQLRTELAKKDEEAAYQAYEAHKIAQRQGLEEKKKLRESHHQARTELASSALQTLHAQQPNPSQLLADTFASSPSFVNAMTDQSNSRVTTMARHKRETLADTTERSKDAYVPTVERDVAELRSPRFREKLDHQLAMMDRFDNDRRVKEREDAKFLSMVQTLQAAEKERQRQDVREQERAEARHRDEALRQEDAMFRGFIEAHLPPNMSPRLVARATGQNPHKV